MDPYFFFVKQQHNNRSSLDEMLKYNELCTLQFQNLFFVTTLNFALVKQNLEELSRVKVREKIRGGKCIRVNKVFLKSVPISLDILIYDIFLSLTIMQTLCANGQKWKQKVALLKIISENKCIFPEELLLFF